MAVEVVTDNEFESRLNDNEKVIVKFFAGWCGSCKLFAPKFRRLSEDERFEGVTFLDVNAEENEAARKRAGVDNLPFFAAFKNGELITSGPTSKEEVVVEMIEKLN
ncbi:MAG: thiol reductase thioredoxin [Flavobacteriales bacterium]|nr:thiol reductase thioredoxin [Flavobacteriales bacterium]|tara:strand:- start:20940 stop:21257 length:318 start_codon:yes stop_codon:yes gene_type:complete